MSFLMNHNSCSLALLRCSILFSGGLLLAPWSASAFSLAETDRTLDRWADALVWESESGDWYFAPSLQFDTTYYHRDDPGNFIGFFFPEPGDHSKVSYRGTLRTSLEYQDWFSLSGKFRADDGVHPGVAFYYGNDGVDYRVDELYALISPDPRFNFQIGQFVPQIGSFLERQDSWDMNLIAYPMAYENVSTASDVHLPADADAFTNRAYNTFKNPLAWVPAIWAPLYTRGASVYGDFGKVTYAVSVLNSNISSRGVWWNDTDFDHPTLTSRVTYRPNAMWRFGLSASTGTYLRFTEASFQGKPNSGLPPGTDFDDYRQNLLGLDVTFAHRDWQVWAEAFWVSYDVANVADDARYFTYYIEGRYQLTTRLWLTARWNQELFDTVATSHGDEKWNEDVSRVDLGLGYRLTRHSQFKVQYSVQDTSGPLQFGEHQLLAEFTIRL
jgi:hypothetical protein